MGNTGVNVEHEYWLHFYMWLWPLPSLHLDQQAKRLVVLLLLSGWMVPLLLWIQINPGFETTHFKHRLAFSTTLLQAECISLKLSSNSLPKVKKSSCHNKMPPCHLSKGKMFLIREDDLLSNPFMPLWKNNHLCCTMAL